MSAELPPRPEQDPGGCSISVPPPAATPDLLDPAGDGERWTVLYTHSNCERFLQRACDRWAIRHYLPIVEQWCGPDRARRRVTAPLFSSYVFACLSYSQRIHVLEVGHVARVIAVAHQDLLLTELRQVRDAIEGGASLTVGPALERGGWVRVVHGPLAGVIGRVEGLRRRKRRHRLVMNVSMLGRGVSTEVDESEVERVHAPGDEAFELVAEGALT
jgi:transcription antitermination factor NusG